MARPRKEIDQKNFESLCGLQCTKEEICGCFDVTDVVYGPLRRVIVWTKGVILAAIVALVVGAELTLVYSIPYLVNLVSLFVSTLVIVEVGTAVFSRGPLRQVVEKL